MNEILSNPEIYGYIASAGVLVSFLMKDLFHLRLVNIFGCSFFVVYGVMLHTSWPIIFTNVAIILINLYYLLSSGGEKKTSEK